MKEFDLQRVHFFAINAPLGNAIMTGKAVNVNHQKGGKFFYYLLNSDARACRRAFIYAVKKYAYKKGL